MTRDNELSLSCLTVPLSWWGEGGGCSSCIIQLLHDRISKGCDLTSFVSLFPDHHQYCHARSMITFKQKMNFNYSQCELSMCKKQAFSALTYEVYCMDNWEMCTQDV